MMAKYSLQQKHGYFHAVVSYKDKDGKHRQKSLTTRVPAVKGNRRKAEKIAAEIVDAWMEVKEENERGAREIGLSDALDMYLDAKRGLIQSNTAAEYGRLGGHIIEITGNKNVSDIDDNEIIKLKNELKGRGDSDNTIRHYIILLNSLLQHAEKCGYNLNRPGYRAEIPKFDRNRGAAWYNVSEVKQLLAAADGSDIRGPVYLAAFLGLRRSEILGLKWENINLRDHIIRICEKRVEYSDNGRVHIEQSDRMKTAYSNRVLPIPAALYEVLESYPNKCGYVVLNAKNEPLAPQDLTRKFASLLEKSGLRKIRFHDLRHTCASLLLQSGVSMKTVQTILGHGSYSTTADVYSHVDLSGKKDAIEKFSSIFQ